MSKVCVIMGGLPGSGKSTFIKELLSLAGKAKQQEVHPTWTVHSSDQEVEAHAKNLGKTYNDVWSTYKDEAEKRFWSKLKQAVEFGDEVIIVDRTNLSKKSRRRIMDAVGKDYKFISVHVFCDNKERMERNAAREGKVIPETVVDGMKKAIEDESFSEGFINIIACNTSTPKENEDISGRFTPKYVYDLIKLMLENDDSKAA